MIHPLAPPQALLDLLDADWRETFDDLIHPSATPPADSSGLSGAASMGGAAPQRLTEEPS